MNWTAFAISHVVDNTVEPVMANAVQHLAGEGGSLFGTVRYLLREKAECTTCIVGLSNHCTVPPIRPSKCYSAVSDCLSVCLSVSRSDRLSSVQPSDCLCIHPRAPQRNHCTVQLQAAAKLEGMRKERAVSPLRRAAHSIHPSLPTPPVRPSLVKRHKVNSLNLLYKIVRSKYRKNNISLKVFSCY
jgi:hypothetical protein